MKHVVVKFGGSNLKKKEDFLKLASVVKQYNRPLVIVISAFFGVTNFMIDVLSKVKDDHSKIEMLTGFLTDIKNGIINQCIPEQELRETTYKELSARLKELERYLLGVHYIGEIPDFIEDKVLSYGERFSSLLLSAILNNEGIKCDELLPENMGLITDGEYGNASLDFDVAEKNVKLKIRPNNTYVVPGFYGISKDGKVNLFGRGGSDYSAASIAHCIDAESLDIWKDVNGFMTADPKLVESPNQIKSLTYTESAELAYFGARILHPRTVEPLAGKEIPIRIFNVDNYDTKLTALTVIGAESEIKNEVVKSVTYSDDLSILKLKGPGVGIKPGILAKVTSKLGAEKINIKTVITSQIQINLLLASDSLDKAYKVTKALNMPAVKQIEVSENISLIALVGEGISDQYGIAARVFCAVARKNINIEMISLGASEVAAYFIVKKEDKDMAIKEIHDEFFDKKNNFVCALTSKT